MTKPVHSPDDFSDIEGLLIAARDPDVPKELLHGTPAIVYRKLDNERYSVSGIFYDGDRKAFHLTVNTKDGVIHLEPGQYQTYALFMFDPEKDELNIFILD